MSLGDFSGGGQLCVESDAQTVTVIDTHNRIAKMDGRFPHWVTGFEGERYSIIYYQSEGTPTPKGVAVYNVN